MGPMVRRRLEYPSGVALADDLPADRRLAAARLDRPRARPADRRRDPLRRGGGDRRPVQRPALLAPRLALAAAGRARVRPRRRCADRARGAAPAGLARDRRRAGRCARCARAGSRSSRCGAGPRACGASSPGDGRSSAGSGRLNTGYRWPGGSLAGTATRARIHSRRSGTELQLAEVFQWNGQRLSCNRRTALPAAYVAEFIGTFVLVFVGHARGLPVREPAGHGLRLGGRRPRPLPRSVHDRDDDRQHLGRARQPRGDAGAARAAEDQAQRRGRLHPAAARGGGRRRADDEVPADRRLSPISRTSARPRST